MDAITRKERFMDAAAKGDASGLPVPVTREEIFLLAAATRDTVGLPDPVTREEAYLKAIAESGGGGGGGEYQILSHIQSNGTQAIRLRDSATPVPEVEVLFEPLSTENYLWILGAEGENDKIFGIQVSTGNANNMRVHRGTVALFRFLNSHASKLTYCRISGTSVNVLWSVDAAATNSTDGALDGSFEPLSPLYAFGVGRITGEDSVSNMIAARLYFVRVGSELFLPARRVSDGACGLLNATTHEFLADELGGDSFVAGDVVGQV